VEGPIFVNRFRESQSECIGSLGEWGEKNFRDFSRNAGLTADVGNCKWGHGREKAYEYQA